MRFLCKPVSISNQGVFLACSLISAVGILCSWHMPCAVGSETPGLHITVIPQSPCQGQAALMRVRADMNVMPVEGTAAGQKLTFHAGPDNETFTALLGIDLSEPPGIKTVTVTAAASSVQPVVKTITFTVSKKDFEVQRLTLPKSQVSLSTKNLDRHKKERKLVTAVLGGTIPSKLWQGGFALPCDAPVSTPFGVKRLMNNKPRSRHSGVDLRAERGTPVLCTNDGRVVLTGNFYFSGNSVFVDHGAGVITMYFHLSSIEVTEGDYVHRGQCLGKVGSTGRSTGPHLHWGARINNQRVDPFSLVALTSAQ